MGKDCVAAKLWRVLFRRTKAHEMRWSLPRLQPLRGKGEGSVFGKIARKDRQFLRSVEMAHANSFPLEGRPYDAREAFIALPRLPLPRGSNAGERESPHIRARKSRAIHAFRSDQPQDCLEPVVVDLVKVIGLGGREHDPVDPPPHD